MSCSSLGNSYIDSFSSNHSDGSMIIDESSFTFSLRSSFTSSSFVDSLTDSSDSDDDSSMYTVNSDNSFLQLCLITMRLSERAVRCHRSRIDWENHALILRHENEWGSTLWTVSCTKKCFSNPIKWFGQVGIRGQEKKGCPKGVRGLVFFFGMGDSTHGTEKKRSHIKGQLGAGHPWARKTVR
jgi:hypothetical protein